MNDSLKMFFIALVTSVASQLLLGPYILRLQGIAPLPAGPSVAQRLDQGPTEPTPAPVEPKLAAPNLQGTLVEDARERWQSKGIEIIEEGERSGSGLKPGTIVQQRPSAGAELSSKEIRVIVAGTSETQAVPDVAGKTVEEARKILQDAGFTVGDATPEASDRPENTVLRQTPAADASARQGSMIRIVVAEPAGIEVPKLTGMYLGKAKQAIEAAGLKVGSIRRAEHAELGEGYILKQAPVAGEKVPPGTEIELVAVAPN